MIENVKAFFTPEVAFQGVHWHSGGLGVFSEAMLSSAKHLGIPMVGVTILPRQGYYDQRKNDKGMKICYESRYYDHILEKTELKFSIPIASTSVWIEVLHLPSRVFNTCDLYLLDTDISENDFLSRTNTLQLYGGSRESGANMDRKIVQSLVLGVGGMEALKRLGISVSLYHLNESHTFFAALAVLKEFLAENDNFKTAFELARNKIVFTTHTPVRAGNPEYDLNTIMRLGTFNQTFRYEELLGIGGDPFNMTAACLRMARKANAVSKKHRDTAEKLWHWVEGKAPIIYITNGTDCRYWQFEEFRIAETQSMMAEAKCAYKRKLLQYIREITGRYLSENIFTIGWARRFEEYKRPKLLFYDWGWIRAKLISNHIQIVMAGKPHPDNYLMIEMCNELHHLSRELPNIVFLAGYDLEMSKIMKAGVDLWLNTPRVPDEACGTSGMSAAMNGAINASTPDGWICEANSDNCFIFGYRHTAVDQDAYDAEELKKCLEQAAEIFYNEKEQWYEKALRAKREAEQIWTSDRMAAQYDEFLYAD